MAAGQKAQSLLVAIIAPAVGQLSLVLAGQQRKFPDLGEITGQVVALVE